MTPSITSVLHALLDSLGVERAPRAETPAAALPWSLADRVRALARQRDAAIEAARLQREAHAVTKARCAELALELERIEREAEAADSPAHDTEGPA